MRVLALQNGQFRSRIKNAKKVRKTVVRPHESACVQKPAQKTPIIPKMRAF